MKLKIHLRLASVHVVVAAALCGCSKSPATKPDDVQAIAAVTTTLIKSGQVSQTVTAYGNVTAQPGAVVVLSAPIECIVKHLRVNSGQAVTANNDVIEIEPSPDARLQWIDARNALESAKKGAVSAHQRLELKLATNADVQTADQAVQTAQIKFDDLNTRGAGDEHKTITAGSASVVAKVDVQEGQLVPAGAALVELVPYGQIEIRLGVEPADAVLLRAGQPVQLFTATVDDAVACTIQLITQRVNPDSRLVDVFATPAKTDKLFLDESVRGELAVKTISGLVVPHDALLPDDNGYSIFTVVGDHAVKHAVKVAVQNNQEAVITGDGVQAGDAVVVTGNLELDDSTPVTATAAAEGEK